MTQNMKVVTCSKILKHLIRLADISNSFRILTQLEVFYDKNCPICMQPIFQGLLMMNLFQYSSKALLIYIELEIKVININ